MFDFDQPLTKAGAAEIRELADSLDRLAADLRRLVGGAAPTSADLEGAPLLNQFEHSVRPELCLRGVVTGHPSIEHGHRAITSGLWAISEKDGWARSLSRWYLLGKRKWVDAA